LPCCISLTKSWTGNDDGFSRALLLPVFDAVVVPVLLRDLSMKMRSPLLSVTLALFILLCCLLASISRNSIYRTPLRLWAATASASPQKQRPHLNFGQTLEVAGYHDQALREFRTVLSIPRDDSIEMPDVYREMGNIYLAAGRYDEAAASYRTGLRHLPSSPTILNNLAIVLLKQNRFDEAVIQAEAALAADPSMANALNTLGQIHVSQGAVDKGIPFLKAAIENAPEFAAPYLNLALAFERKGDYETAYRYASAYVAADTSPAGRKRAAELLDRLQNKKQK
jgi:tetratricopeptide (TPR) repeat protein